MALIAKYLLLLFMIVIVHGSSIVQKVKIDITRDSAKGNEAIISHDEFLSRFNKTYENEAETIKRKNIFQDNVQRMEDHNKLYKLGKSSFMMGVNEFSDMTYDEVVSKLTGAIDTNLTDLFKQIKRQHTLGYWYIPLNNGHMPDSMDYRDMGAVNPIRNQNPCASCWAFSAVGGIESKIFLNNGQLEKLSEQYLIDCSNKGSCNKGYTGGAIEYVESNGIPLGSKYGPYTAKDGSCKPKIPKILYKVMGIQRVKIGSDTDLLNALVYTGPISVIFQMNQEFRDFWGNASVLNSPCTNNDEDYHAVVLVGYGTQDGQDYWLIRNSWGTSWGDKGYGKLSRKINNYCQISSNAFIPITTGCPQGFLNPIGSRKCYKVFKDKYITFNESKQKCEKENLTMAHPSDNVAVTLRKDLLIRYGSGRTWLDARGLEKGYQFQWQDDDSILYSTNKLWPVNWPNKNGWPGQQFPTGTSACLVLSVWEDDYNNYPDSPYLTQYCDYGEYTLCETDQIL